MLLQLKYMQSSLQNGDKKGIQKNSATATANYKFCTS